MSLTELLRGRAIAHPTHIEQAVFRGADLRVVISGYPWWSAEPQLAGTTVALDFLEISDGIFYPEDLSGEPDEALDNFEIRDVADISWLQPSRYSIFCSGPTPDPAAVFAEMNEYLWETDAFRHVGDFLNGGELFSRFQATACSRSYLIGRGPAVVRDLICCELTRQGVPHNVVETDIPPARGLLVVIGRCQFVCAEAWAEFSGPGEAR